MNTPRLAPTAPTALPVSEVVCPAALAEMEMEFEAELAAAADAAWEAMVSGDYDA
jgi:hypothetical protein